MLTVLLNKAKSGISPDKLLDKGKSSSYFLKKLLFLSDFVILYS